MTEQNKNGAQSTLPDGQYVIPSFHGGQTYGVTEDAVQSDRIRRQGSAARQPRWSGRLQQQTEQDSWNNSHRMANNTSHQMGYKSNDFSADSFASYNDVSNTTSNPYMAYNETVSQTPITTTSNFGWGAMYATPTSFLQQPAAPIMQQQWLQIQSAQQMMMPQPMLGGFGTGQSFFTNMNGMHQQQIRHMSTGDSFPKQRYNRMSHPESNVLETSEKRQYVRATSKPPISVTSAPSAANSKDGIPSAFGAIRSGSAQVEQPMTPLPLNSYLEQAAKEPLDLQFMQPLLIILDLNGTLLYRRRKAFPPKFTRRPALNYFLERLTSRHEVMVWSSSRQDTVDAICNQIFSPVQREKLVARWSRDHLDLTKEQFNNKVQVYKVLEKVWADANIQARFPTKKTKSGKAAFNALRYTPGLDQQKEMTGFLNKRWDQSNTVLIDDSTLKAAANPYNIIEVPEFTNVPNENDTTVLKELLLKIRVLAKSNDVSRRLRALGPEGIQIRREEVLASASESEREAEHIKKEEKKGKGEGEKVVGTTEVFETDNKIVPISLPPKPKQGPKKAKAKAEKAARKAKKQAKKQKALLDAPKEGSGGLEET